MPKKQPRAGGGEAKGDADELGRQVHLKVIESILAGKNENGGLSLPDQEKAEAIKGDQNKHREHEVHRTGHVDKNMQAPPNLRQAWQPIRSRIIFAVGGVISHKWRKQEADGDHRGPPFTPLEEVVTAQDGSNKKEDEDPRPDRPAAGETRTATWRGS